MSKSYAYSQNYNLDVNGGSDRQTFSVGATYAKTEGILKYNNLDVVTLRVNNTYKLKYGISLGVNVVYSNRQTVEEVATEIITAQSGRALCALIL